MSKGTELITAERQRQIEEEGFTAAHDRQHADGALALAAICYAAPVAVYITSRVLDQDGIAFVDPWPFKPEADKRPRSAEGRLYLLQWSLETAEEQIRRLVKAGALIAAEIDRILDLEGEENGHG